MTNLEVLHKYEDEGFLRQIEEVPVFEKEKRPFKVKLQNMIKEEDIERLRKKRLLEFETGEIPSRNVEVIIECDNCLWTDIKYVTPKHLRYAYICEGSVNETKTCSIR